MINHTVPEGLREEELSRYLRRAWPMLPGYALRTILNRRDVRVNGRKSGKGTLVHGKDELQIYGEERWFEADVPVLFDDGHLLAVVKPQGLPVDVDMDGVGADTLQTRIARLHPGAVLCHRLDAMTGGIVLCALDDTTRDRAFEMFKAHEVEKHYTAILVKRPPEDRMELRAFLYKDARHANVRISEKDGKDAKSVVTRYRWIREERGYTVADLWPVTGRTHQLRAHMAYIGCPILGDDKYGDRERNRSGGFADRLCLWCREIHIPKEGPMAAYGGREFIAECPDWLGEKRET